MTSPGCDLYMFDESEPNAEWRNNRDTPIDELVQPYGYLFASPNDLELSLTGSTKMSGSYNLPNVPYYENPNNNFNGWYLLGNFLTCDVYIYRQDDDGEYIPMELMVYNEEGEKVTLSAGPISPMSAFFVKLTETTTIKYYYYPISSARPAGALKGKFTVNSNGDQVRFSQGNLQYIGSASTPYWKFADKQWETLGNNGTSTATSLAGARAAMTTAPFVTNLGARAKQTATTLPMATVTGTSITRQARPTGVTTQYVTAATKKTADGAH